MLLHSILAEGRSATFTRRLVLAFNVTESTTRVRSTTDVEIGSGIVRIGKASVAVVAGLFEDGECAARCDCLLFKCAGNEPSAWSNTEKAALRRPRQPA
jgi:hypothetical protein